MSVKAIGWAFDQRTGDPGLKVLLLALANLADESGICVVTRALLADRCEISERTVSRKVKLLEDLGFLDVVPSRLGHGGRTVNHYRLLMQRGARS